LPGFFLPKKGGHKLYFLFFSELALAHGCISYRSPFYSLFPFYPFGSYDLN
jgi:hypothetical protein